MTSSDTHMCVGATCAICGVPACELSTSYPSRFEDVLYWTHDLVHPQSLELGFALHRSCWDIFLQQYHILGTTSALSEYELVFHIRERLVPVRRREDNPGQLPFLPRWCELFRDPVSGKGPANARFPSGWFKKGYSIREKVNRAAAGLSNEMDFLLYDPVEGLPLLKIHTGDMETEQSAPYLATSNDVFSILPVELIGHILTYLPSEDVSSLQEASSIVRSIPLTSQYWSSRFQYPHELSLISAANAEAVNIDPIGDETWKDAYEKRAAIESIPEIEINARRIQHCSRKLANSILAQEKRSGIRSVALRRSI